MFLLLALQQLLQKKVGNDAKLSLSDVDEMILVRGSSGILAIQELDKKMVGKGTNDSVYPNGVFTLEVAVQGGVLVGDATHCFYNANLQTTYYFYSAIGLCNMPLLWLQIAKGCLVMLTKGKVRLGRNMLFSSLVSTFFILEDKDQVKGKGMS